MATVTVDISEYDMLRDRNKELISENKILKENIEGLKDSSRVIIKTKLCSHSIDIKGAVLRTINRMGYLGRNATGSMIATYLEQELRQSTMTHNTYSLGTNNLECFSESMQVVGFDDVEHEVKAKFMKEAQVELDNKILDLQKAKHNYEEKVEKVSADYNEKFGSTIESLEKEIEDLKVTHREELNNKLKELSKKEDEIKQLSKSREEKIRETEDKLKAISKELEELQYSKPRGFWARLFNK